MRKVAAGEEEALEHLRTVYGAHVMSVGALVGPPLAAGVGAAVLLGVDYENGEVLEHEP